MGKNASGKRSEAKRKSQLTQQEYDKLKYSAYQMIVVQGSTQKYAAEILGVSEVTMSNWARDGKFKEAREARQTSTETDIDNTKKIISLLSKQRYDIELEILNVQKTGDTEAEINLRKQARGISDEISKHNKVLLSLNKEDQYTLGILINVMDDIFTAMREYDDELFAKTIPFQQYYIRKRTNELG